MATSVEELELWLGQATRKLSQDSRVRVQNEIRDHYELALEEAMQKGLSAEEAGRNAVAALGDAKRANCEYRRVLLTTAEARLLREGNWEARAFCSRPWLRWICLAVSLCVLAAGTALLLRGAGTEALAVLAAGSAMGLIFSAPFLRVDTPLRGRIFRSLKWGYLAATLVFAFAPHTLQWSWLMISSMWPMVSIEWTRFSIRRKLPVAEWPKQLFL